MYGGKRCADGIELGFVRLAQEFQRDMHAFRANPAGAGAFGLQTRHQLAKRAANGVGNIEGDEQAHGSSSSMWREKKIPADGVERLLRGLEADALAVTRKGRRAFGAAALVGDADMYGADWYIWASPTSAAAA